MKAKEVTNSMKLNQAITKAFGSTLEIQKVPKVTLKNGEQLIYQLPLSMKEMNEQYKLGKLL